MFFIFLKNQSNVSNVYLIFYNFTTFEKIHENSRYFLLILHCKKNFRNFP